jgi:hypothetical protein
MISVEVKASVGSVLQITAHHLLQLDYDVPATLDFAPRIPELLLLFRIVCGLVCCRFPT